MRHRVKGRKFGRVRKTRKALMKSVLRSFVEYGKIETTLPKAKEVGIISEKLVTKAKKGDLAGRREIMKCLTLRILEKPGNQKNLLKSWKLLID